MHTTYGNTTQNGIYVSDMINNGNDIVYKNPLTDDYFARLTGWFGNEKMEDEAKPAIAVFSYEKPFEAIYAKKLPGTFKKYIDWDTGVTTKDFGKALTALWTEFPGNVLTINEITKMLDDIETYGKNLAKGVDDQKENERLARLLVRLEITDNIAEGNIRKDEIDSVEEMSARLKDDTKRLLKWAEGIGMDLFDLQRAQE